MATDSVIIIGAARSGTNMLRDMLTSLLGIETWPCDEIPYVWRYRHAGHPHDEFTPSMADQRTRRYIRGAFDRMAWLRRAEVLVEKTCANVLRVEFVRAVLPEAKIVYLRRDGRDVVASAMKRWVAPFDLRYSARKAPFVPLTDLPYYGARFVWNRAKQFLSEEKRLASWGPCFDGMVEMARHADLHEVCAHQWLRSVEAAERAFEATGEENVHRVGYEEFVTDPVNQLRGILEFAGRPFDEAEIEKAVGAVSNSSVGKGRAQLDEQTLDRVTEIIRPGLERYGYEV